jgi:hypothetical protein
VDLASSTVPKFDYQTHNHRHRTKRLQNPQRHGRHEGRHKYREASSDGPQRQTQAATPLRIHGT